MRHLLLAVAVLAFFGATVGTAFGMTSSNSADKRTTSQHATQGRSTSPSGDQAAQDASSGDGDQTGQGDQNGQTGQTGTNGQTGTTTTTKVNVPWVKNQNETYARNQLKDAGLTAQVKYVCQDGVDPWTVVDQSPNGDTQANKGSKVQLKVQGVKVLGVVGTYHADAKSQLEGQGLKVVEKDAQPGDSGGAVSKQSPAGGSCVKPGTTVTITVGTTTTDPSTSPSAASNDTTNGQTEPTN